MIRDLGVLAYPEAHALQKDLARRRGLGEAEDTLLFVEHPHVFTVGRRGRELTNVLDAGGVPVVLVERGGDVTYHGPGQVVAYPVLQLPEGRRDAPAFLRHLEGWVIDALAQLGVPGAERSPGFSGVFCQGKKVASAGVAITERWVTWHGIALNVATDLAWFHRINPCGLSASVMTTVTALAGRDVTPAEAREALVATWRWP